MTRLSRSYGKSAVLSAGVGGSILTIACSNASTQSGATGAASTASASPAPAATPARAPSGATFCGTLQPLVQPLVKPALSLFQASDATTDDLHRGEPHYVDCDFRFSSGQFDVGLHDDADHQFDDATAKGYAPLPGFGDHARYLVKQQEMRWVDVVRGSTACEARFTMADSQIKGDWKQAAGNACNAALSVR